MVALWLLIAFLGGSVVVRKPYLKQTLSSTPNGADKYESIYVGVLICT